MRREGSIEMAGDRSPAFHTLAGYGLGDAGFLLVWHGSALFLLYAYTDILGLTPALAGLIYLVAMIWDAVSDPLIAAWAERRAARTGTYSGLIALAALPVGLTYALLYVAPPGAPWAVALWALAAHLVFRTAYTIASMPYNTLPVRLTTDGKARSALSGWRVVGAATGGILTAVLTPLIAGQVLAGGASEGTGYAVAALAIGALSATFLFACARLVGEPVRPGLARPAPGFRAAMTGMLAAARHNPPFRTLIGLIVLGTIGGGFFTHNALYFMTHVIGRPDAITLVLASSALATVFAAPAWVILAGRTSKRTSLMTGLAVAAVGYLLLGFASGPDLLVPLIGVIIAGAGGAAIPVMLWSMVPDTIEHGEAETGERVEARSFGLTTFAQKTAVGITVLLAGGLLSLAGYGESAAPSEDALLAIRLMVSALPAGIFIATLFWVRTYPINAARHAEILKQLAERQTR